MEVATQRAGASVGRRPAGPRRVQPLGERGPGRSGTVRDRSQVGAGTLDWGPCPWAAGYALQSRSAPRSHGGALHSVNSGRVEPLPSLSFPAGYRPTAPRPEAARGSQRPEGRGPGGLGPSRGRTGARTGCAAAPGYAGAAWWARGWGRIGPGSAGVGAPKQGTARWARPHPPSHRVTGRD